METQIPTLIRENPIYHKLYNRNNCTANEMNSIHLKLSQESTDDQKKTR